MKNNKKNKFKIADIVFISIMALAALLSCSIMPLVVPFLDKIFGISQLATSFQISLFFSIGLYKVRKQWSLLIMATIMGSVMLIMSWIMFVVILMNALILELLSYTFFNGFKKTVSIFLAVSFLNTLSLPANYLFNIIMSRNNMTAIAGKNIGVTIGITIAVLVISMLGSIVGILIGREIKKIRESKNVSQ